IGSGKVENATQVTKHLQNITNQHLCVQTVRNGLRKVGMKAVVKRKSPPCYRSILKRGWILPQGLDPGGLKRLCGQMRPKLIVWGQMGGSRCGRRLVRV